MYSMSRLTRRQGLVDCSSPPTNTASPVLEEITAFQIPGNCFIKLNVGTWHAGPYFDDKFADFYNLELSDPNINDYEIYS